MVESSIFWATNGVGDGLVGGYSSGAIVEKQRGLWSDDPAFQGVMFGFGNDLEITNPAGLNLSMDTGGAVVYGYQYSNTVAVVLPLVLPLINTTGWRWVLRTSWAAQTVRGVLLQSADGVAAIPALTHTPGVTWEISLAHATVTVGGVIAITDDRTFLKPGIVIDEANMENRTMRILVPAVECILTAGSTHVVRTTQGGWPLVPSVDTACFGGFHMPRDADLTQPFLVDPVIYPSATSATNIRITTTGNMGNVTESWFAHTVNTLVTVVSGNQDIIQTPPAAQLDLQPLGDIGDIISFAFARLGSIGLDTFLGTVFFMGWRLNYTRDH